jgi:hypothetical protein
MLLRRRGFHLLDTLGLPRPCPARQRLAMGHPPQVETWGTHMGVSKNWGIPQMVVSQILMYGEDDHFLDQPVWTQDIWIKETRPG